MLIGAIVCTVAGAGLGLACIGYSEDNSLSGAIVTFTLHLIAVIAMSVLYCLYSPVAILACGGVLSSFSVVSLICVCSCKNYETRERLWCSMIFTVNFIGAVVCYMNVYHFLALGISCSAIFIFAVINIGTTLAYKYGWSASDELPFNIVNIIFAVLAVAGATTGLLVYFTSDNEIDVDMTYEIYSYDYVNARIAEEADFGELYYNEYYALKLNFNWSGLHSLATSTKDISINVTFPAEITAYISDGVEFEKSKTDKKVWSHEFELTSKTSSDINSGYFVFKYSYGSLSIPVSPVKVEISEISEEEELFERTFSCSPGFNRRKYEFSSADCIKNLSVAEDGNYIINVPDGCKAFKISIYNSNKTGAYYIGTATVNGENYMLDITNLLKNNVSESVFTAIKENKEKLVIVITAVGNDSYDDTSIELNYTAE